MTRAKPSCRPVVSFLEVFIFHQVGGWPVLSYFQINHDTFVELMLVTLTDHQVARLTA